MNCGKSQNNNATRNEKSRQEGIFTAIGISIMAVGFGFFRNTTID